MCVTFSELWLRHWISYTQESVMLMPTQTRYAQYVPSTLVGGHNQGSSWALSVARSDFSLPENKGEVTVR